MITLGLSKCPLCDADALFEFRDSNNLEFFHCATCGDFLISQSAITWLERQPSRKANLSRLSASLRSKQVIEVTADTEAEGLHIEKVPRNKYPE